MIFSRDHTYVRLAALPEDVIRRLIDQYPGIQAYTPTTTYVDMVRGIEAEFARVLPGKEDLVTQWFLAYLDQSNRTKLKDSVAQFRDLAVWYFAHVKEDKFKKLVKEHSTVTERYLNPKNLLDFSVRDMEYIKNDYAIQEEAAQANVLSGELPEGAELFYDDGEHQIVKVTGADAACKMGMGTQWCTREEPFAGSYVIQSPLYVIYRNKQKAAQFYLGHPKSAPSKIELKNLKNKPMKPDAGIRRALIGSGLMDQLLERVGRVEYGEEVFRNFTGGEDSPYLRKACAKKPWLAYFYARNILHDNRFPEGEPAIAQDGEVSLVYASTVVHGRFPAGERAIVESGHRGLYVHVLQHEEKDLEGLAVFQKEYPWES